MAQLFELINDITLSYDGDLLLDDTNDLQLISGEEWFKREVNKIVRTKVREWRSEPDIGIDLTDNIGKQNTRENAEDLRERILEALTLDNFQFPGEFNIKIVPTDVDKLTIYITYNVLGETLNINKLIYDINKGLSVPIVDELDTKTQKPAPSKRKENANVYLNSLKR